MTILAKLMQVIHINPYLTVSLLYYYVLHFKDFFSYSRYVQCGISKKGFTTCHILLWLDGEKKLRNPTDIDGVISAKLPDAILYPKLSKAVATYMIHGP